MCIIGFMKNKKYKSICTQCNKKIECSQPNQKFCTKSCRNNYHGRNRLVSINSEVSSGTVGCITELEISIYFMKKGYAVFRSLSPACFCDLIVIKNKEVMYLEVRTGYLSASGAVNFPKRISTKGGKPTHYAVYTAFDKNISLIKI